MDSRSVTVTRPRTEIARVDERCLALEQEVLAADEARVHRRLHREASDPESDHGLLGKNVLGRDVEERLLLANRRREEAEEELLVVRRRALRRRGGSPGGEASGASGRGSRGSASSTESGGPSAGGSGLSCGSRSSRIHQRGRLGHGVSLDLDRRDQKARSLVRSGCARTDAKRSEGPRRSSLPCRARSRCANRPCLRAASARPGSVC